MSSTNRVAWELLRTFDTSTIASGIVFYNVGGPLLYPSYKLKMVNASNILVTVSIDNVHSYDVCPPNSFWLYDEMQAQLNTASSPSIPAGTQISVNYPTGTAGSGLIYLVSQYLVQN
jgi:hypothetical protein